MEAQGLKQSRGNSDIIVGFETYTYINLYLYY